MWFRDAVLPLAAPASVQSTTFLLFLLSRYLPGEICFFFPLKSGRQPCRAIHAPVATIRQCSMYVRRDDAHMTCCCQDLLENSGNTAFAYPASRCVRSSVPSVPHWSALCVAAYRSTATRKCRHQLPVPKKETVESNMETTGYPKLQNRPKGARAGLQRLRGNSRLPIH